MRVVLDTHCLIWAVDDPARLSPAALAAVGDVSNDRLVSMASIWEMAIKCGSGKLKLSSPFRPWIDKALTDLAVTILSITVSCAEAQITLPTFHRDPFARLLIAQATLEGMKIVSSDAVFDQYGPIRLW